MSKHQHELPLTPWPQRFLLASVAMVTFTFSLLCCFFLSERFFFDKLFYKKSVIHGYYNRWYYDTKAIHLNWLDRQLIRARERDLTDLLDGKVWSKKPGVKTVAVIGDSHVYGVGIRASQRFSNLLAGEFQRQGVAASVYTFAEPGNSIMDDFALYQLIKKQLNPDLIILGIVSNDLFFNVDRYPGDSENTARFSTICPGSLYVAIGAYYNDNAGYVGAVRQTFSSRWTNRCYLTEIAKTLGQDSHLLYFNFNPTLSTIACLKADGSEETQFMHQYMNVLELQGVRGLSHISHDLSKNEYVSSKEEHFSSTAHQKYAQEISQFVLHNFWNTKPERTFCSGFLCSSESF